MDKHVLSRILISFLFLVAFVFAQEAPSDPGDIIRGFNPQDYPLLEGGEAQQEEPEQENDDKKTEDAKEENKKKDKPKIEKKDKGKKEDLKKLKDLKDQKELEPSDLKKKKPSKDIDQDPADLVLANIKAENTWKKNRPDGIPPAGISEVFVQRQAELLLYYSFDYHSLKGLLNGTDKVSGNQVIGPNRAYIVAPSAANYLSHMIKAKVGILSWFGLGLTFNIHQFQRTIDMYNINELTSGSQIGVSKGIGDLLLDLTFGTFEYKNHLLHTRVSLSIPTGSISETYALPFLGENASVPFGVQPGTGTWDFHLGLLYQGQKNFFSWGINGGFAIPLAKNNNGYKQGMKFVGGGWIAFNALPWLSISGRLLEEFQLAVEGKDTSMLVNSNGAALDVNADSKNTGASLLTGGIGVNFYIPKGTMFIKGQRVALEFLYPIFQKNNGVQLKTRWKVIAAWQYSFSMKEGENKK